MIFFRALSIATIIVPVVLLIGIIRGVHYYSSLKSENKTLVIYLMGCFFADITSRLAGEFYKNNLIIMVAFSLFELLFFSIFYQVYLFKRKKIFYTIVTITGCLYIGYELHTLSNLDPKYFQTYSKTYTAFFIIFMGIDYFFEKIQKEYSESLKVIELNSVFVLYFSLNLILFLPVNFLINVNSPAKFYFWFINLLVTLCFYLFLTKKIWKNGLIQKQLQSG